MSNEIGFFVIPAATVNGKVYERRDGVWRLAPASLTKMINEALADAPDNVSDDDVTRAAVDAGAAIAVETAPQLEREWEKFWPTHALAMTEYASR